uniref:Calcium release activated channel regulator 2A n=1 Tax=Myripristis murdjan TaxID=586833 RepID=A0A667ZTW5_9TELE
MEEESRVNGCGLNPERRSSDWGRIALLGKTKEFFQTCDVEGKGFITRTDMRRLHRELPLSAEELEDVFDSLDTDRTGYLTLEAFSSGFSRFLFSLTPAPGSVLRAKEALYQSQWDAKLAGEEDEEEKHFCMLLESLGASNVFEDAAEVRSLWAQLRRDEPHLLSNFEEFLARVTSQIKEAHQERKEMESALQRKAATHDSEIRRLYEEMEIQIKNEKDRLLLKDSERFHLRSQDLEHQLFAKERELEQLFQKQKRLELQCSELSSQKQESRVENVKLKMTNDELSRELESTMQELTLAQEQLAMLQEQATRLQQEKEMEMYRVTEGLQREKQNQHPMNTHNRERAKEAELERKTGVEEEVLDAPPDGWPLRRVISIEEDHLPHLLHGGPQPLLHQLSEEEEEEEDDEVDDEEEEDDAQNPIATPPSNHTSGSALPPSARKPRFTKTKKTPMPARGQPVGKETQTTEGALLAPDRLFKVVLVGNSSVGKTSLLRSFCEGRFHPSTSATVGIDYSVKTLTLDDTQVAMQLWDTAGQERYRSITKQFFRKADGVVVMYDVTVDDSFRAVRPWLANVQTLHIMRLWIFCSSLLMCCFLSLSLYRVLKEQEDRVRDTTVILSAQPIKRKACCK